MALSLFRLVFRGLLFAGVGSGHRAKSVPFRCTACRRIAMKLRTDVGQRDYINRSERVGSTGKPHQNDMVFLPKW